MSKKKVNPRKKPASEADIKRAKDDAAEKAIKMSDILILTVLLDRFGFGVEELNEAWIALHKLADEISEKRVSLYDLRKVLRDEYYIDV